MKAVVHIGTEKTGTTTIQQFLFANRKKLARYGYHFLQSAGPTNNWALPAYCSLENRFDDFYRGESIETDEELASFKKDFVRKFDAEMKGLEAGIHTVVISSEHFHSRLRLEDEVQRAREFLGKYFSEIKVICYLREQAATCTSWYSTSMKSVGTDSFTDFVRRCNPDSYYFNYMQVLGNWEKYFGENALDVAIFDQDAFLNGSLLDDFIARVDARLPGNLEKVRHAANQSLNPAGQALARAINLALPVHESGDGAAQLRSRLKEIISAKLSGRGQQMTLQMRQAIYDRFAESNELVRQKYFPARETMFAYPHVEEPSPEVVGNALFDVLQALYLEIASSANGGAIVDREALWLAISESVADAVSVRQGKGQEGVTVSLTPRDGAILRRAAKRIESRDLEAAKLLMELALVANPKLPGIQAKLAEYAERVNEPPKLDFMFTYHGGSTPDGEEERRVADARLAEWSASLDVPFGAPIRPFIHRTVVTGSAVDKDLELSTRAFTLFSAASLEEAIEIAMKCPHLEHGGEVQVVQLKRYSDMRTA